jgi:hypothetical protein
MRIAHVIFAYKDPAQIERLIKTLSHPEFDFYIHLDKKIKKKPFEYLSKMERVRFIKKTITCNWGGFSLVKAMLQSIDEIQATGIQYDFVNLLSGQDYPIEPVNKIYDFFNNNLGYSFLKYEASRQSEWWKKAEIRYKRYHFTDFTFFGRYQIQKLTNWLLPERKFPGKLTLYGSQVATWSTLSFESAIYLSDYIKNHPKLARFLGYTWGCDEFTFVTILMNSKFKDKVVNGNYRYITFPEGESQPKIFTVDDYDEITQSKMLFARKFDINVDTQILDRIDARIHHKQL